MSFRVVRITRAAVDDRTFEQATEAQDAARALYDGEAGVEYVIAHVSYPVSMKRSQ